MIAPVLVHSGSGSLLRATCFVAPRQRQPLPRCASFGHSSALSVSSLQALSLSPSNPKLHTVRAYCYAMIGWFAEAVADYDAVLGLEPGNAHAAYNRWEGGEGARRGGTSNWGAWGAGLYGSHVVS